MPNSLELSRKCLPLLIEQRKSKTKQNQKKPRTLASSFLEKGLQALCQSLSKVWRVASASGRRRWSWSTQVNDSEHWPLDQWAPVAPMSLQCTTWKYTSPEKFHKKQLPNCPRSLPAQSGKAHTLQVSMGDKNSEIKEELERVMV